MTRRFMLAVVALLLAAPCVPNVSWAAGRRPDRVVFPTGDWPTDVRNVQAAVDRGGTVLLKAKNVAGHPTAFNFGTATHEQFLDLWVDVTTDVWIRGESVGSARTTITGGWAPISVGFARTFVEGEWFPTYDGESPHVKIESLNFEGPLEWAILVQRSAGVEIIGNRISNVLGHGSFDQGRGITLYGDGERITGKVIIASNIVEDMHAGLSDGILVSDVAADVDIVGNRVGKIQSFAGISMIRHVEGTVRIAYNFVAPGPSDQPYRRGNRHLCSTQTTSGTASAPPAHCTKSSATAS
jgi:hypothetical protein